MVDVRYIWHDCFVVRHAGVNLVFDYWREPPGGAPGQSHDIGKGYPAFLDGLDPDMPLYVFVSHSHKDHYNPEIFDWSSRFPKVHYVVSRDVMKRCRHIASATSVYAGQKIDPSQITALSPGETACFGDVTVAAFPSTDIGVSYLVGVGEKRFFHAGDLNAWIWLDESTEAEVRKALGDYRACLRDIGAFLDAHPRGAAEYQIDYCFFPVDSRIGREYYTGARMFTEKLGVGRFFPMHFGLGDEEEQRLRMRDALRFEAYAVERTGEYIPLAVPYSMFRENE